MWKNEYVRTAIALCYEKSRFLYEIIPEFFNEQKLTEVEILLWSKYYDYLKNIREQS